MAIPHFQVREELLEQFRRANERFRESRAEWEMWLDSSEFRHDERIDAARQKLRDAEREVEEVEERIRRILSSGGQPS
jgi:hypothetical protein